MEDGGDAGASEDGDTVEGDGADEGMALMAGLEFRYAGQDQDRGNATDAYRVFETRFDEWWRRQIVRFGRAGPVTHDAAGTWKMSPVVGKLASRLQRKLMAHQNRSWDFDLEEGIRDARKLHRVVTQPLSPLSYKMEQDTKFRDTVVTLLLNNSGSMRGRLSPLLLTPIFWHAP